MDLNRYQQLIHALYHRKDSHRGVDRTFVWLVEEIGELARAVRRGSRAQIQAEFADCLAWLLSLGDLLGIDAEEAMRQYVSGCPKCGRRPCRCAEPTPRRRAGAKSDPVKP